MSKNLKIFICNILVVTMLLTNISVIALATENEVLDGTSDITAELETEEVEEEIIYTGEGSWRIGDVYYDSAEALGVNPNAIQLMSNEIYGELSEYTIESEYFIFDESLQSYLINNVSPQIFNEYIQNLDLTYETMSDLIGRVPVQGQKIRIREAIEGSDCDKTDYIQHVHTSDGIICWNPEHNGGFLSDMQAKEGKDWWYSGTLHEIGHLFESICPWDWAGEGWATYFAWIAIRENNGTMYCEVPSNWTDEIYDGFFDDFDKFSYNETTYISYNNPLEYYWYYKLPELFKTTEFDIFDKRQHEMIYLLNPVFEELGWTEGYQFFQKVFNSYFNYYMYPTMHYEGTEKQRRLKDFIERCSYFMEVELDTLWLSGVEDLYTNALIPPTTPYVVLGSIAPKIGDELKFYAYNCLSEGTYTVHYELGNGAGFRTKNIVLNEGNNEGVSLEYIIKYEDIGKDFVMYIKNYDESGNDVWSEDTGIIPHTNIKADFNPNINYSNGTFTMNGIELTTDVLSAEEVYFKIDKYIGSECINMAEGVVNVNDSGKWEFLCEPISLELTSIESHIEVNVYEDSSCQKLITKQLIIPLSFVF